MSDLSAISTQHAVLVSDFDGTVARPDFYHLVRQRLVPAGSPDFWEQYRSGEITHFDALKGYFQAARGSDSEWRDIIADMQMPDDFPAQIQRLNQAGWQVVIVSAGCQWYIDILLQRVGGQVPVLANLGQLVDGHLVMRRPSESPFYCQETGIDKALVVSRLQQRGHTVAFAGDGFTDLRPCRLVDPALRFARSDLAEACRQEKLDFRPFDAWTDVIDCLVQRNA